ncbi:MAG: sugar transferase [Bacteroidota bacterium]|jgi:lipopolysaccharide/colanic/teichoic acid biosynthesis glycosyltransferase
MIKRLFDIFFSCLGLLIAFPFLLLAALLIKFDSPGPVLFKQVRVGKDYRLFTIYKLRTMINNIEHTKMQLAVPSDSRITPVGRFLRRTKIDELPQLINVLFGDMSFVGPRPEDPRYSALYNEEQKKIFDVRPGITSPASLYYRDEASLLGDQNWEEKYTKEIMPEKISIDMKYFENNTFWNDCGIIYKTIISVIHINTIVRKIAGFPNNISKKVFVSRGNR